jgi:integrase
MGRRPTKNLNLPAGLRSRTQRSGKTYYYLDTGEKPRREIPLGPDYVIAVTKWAELTKVGVQLAPATFKDVADLYLRKVVPTKAPRTQRDNVKEIANLLAFFNDPPIAFEGIEPQHVRQYLTWRGESAKVRANREKALLSHIWNMARDWGLTVLPNPCAGIKGFKETGRDIYVEDEVLQAVYAAASRPLQDALDLAYMTGQRPADVLKMSATHIRDGALRVGQGKTAKKLQIAIEDSGQPNELGRKLAEIADRKSKGRVLELALVVNLRGSRMTAYALDSAFDAARTKAAATAKKAGNDALAQDIKAFQFRDLRAKAGTDKAGTDGIQAAQRQLGHASIRMTEHYVRLGDKVTPTGLKTAPQKQS